jgi:predicted transcriptional regulator
MSTLALSNRPTFAAKAVRQIIDRLCDGSVEQLLVGMVDNEVIDKRDLANLARKISKRKSGEGV